MGTLFQSAETPGGALINAEVGVDGDILDCAKLNELRDAIGDDGASSQLFDFTHHTSLMHMIGSAWRDDLYSTLVELGQWSYRRPVFGLACNGDAININYGDLIYIDGQPTPNSGNNWYGLFPYAKKALAPSNPAIGVCLGPPVITKDMWDGSTARPAVPPGDAYANVLVYAIMRCVIYADTSTYTQGEILYLDDTTPGAITNDVNGHQIGVVLSVASKGQILIDIPVTPPNPGEVLPSFIKPNDWTVRTGTPTQNSDGNWELAIGDAVEFLFSFPRDCKWSHTRYVWYKAHNSSGNYNIGLQVPHDEPGTGFFPVSSSYTGIFADPAGTNKFRQSGNIRTATYEAGNVYHYIIHRISCTGDSTDVFEFCGLELL